MIKSSALKTAFLFFREVATDGYWIMRILTPGQPTLRRYLRQNDSDFTMSDELIENPVAQRVLTLLRGIGNPHQDERAHLLLDYLKTYCSKEPKARKYISPLV
jgi:hypothetical protein